MRRKAYLLLELLIAFAILSLSALPLVRNPMHSARSEIASFERMELERIAELSYGKVMEQLIRNEIPWEALLAKQLPKTPWREESFALEVPGLFKRNYRQKSLLWSRGEKRGPQEELRLVGLKILFEPEGRGKREAIAFSYSFFLSGDAAE